jgi:hypothetical protein
MSNKTLYLSSGDYKDFRIVRRIERFGWIALEDHNYLIIEVDLPLNLVKDSSSNLLIKSFYLLHRFIDQATTFKNLSHFPVYVHVLIPKLQLDKKLNSFNDFTNLAWATLSDDLKDVEDEFNRQA